MLMKFKDVADFNNSDKTAITIRSGVLYYTGAEINKEPLDKLFSFYRSPATIANVASKLPGLYITDEHVDTEAPPPTDGGTILSSKVVDVNDNNGATMAVSNVLSLSDSMIAKAQLKKQLSLGYHAEVVEHDVYDFEQKEIEPHHLAIVPKGRCGDLCSFVDSKPDLLINKESNKMKKDKVAEAIKNAFIDAEGVVNMQTIVETMEQLPDAVRKVPLDQLKKLVPLIQKIIAASKEVAPDEQLVEETVEGETPAEDEAPAEDTATEDEATDTETEEVEVKDEAPAEEEDKDEDKEEKSNFSDSTAFKDAVEEATKAFTDKALTVIQKARQFVDAEYSFEGKDINQIMRDALETESKDSFTDAELDVAFKLLKKTANYGKFGDGEIDTRGRFSAIGDDSIGGE